MLAQDARSVTRACRHVEDALSPGVARSETITREVVLHQPPIVNSFDDPFPIQIGYPRTRTLDLQLFHLSLLPSSKPRRPHLLQRSGPEQLLKIFDAQDIFGAPNGLGTRIAPLNRCVFAKSKRGRTDLLLDGSEFGGFDAPILRPTLFGRVRSNRTLVAVAHGLDATAVDALPDQIVATSLGTLLGESRVRLGVTLVVRVASNLDARALHVRHVLDNAVQSRKRLGTNRR